MSVSSDDYLLTYGSHVETHDDSSDFEDLQNPSKITVKDRAYSPKVELKELFTKTQDEYDIYPTKINKTNLVKERKPSQNPKLLPCLSSFFKRKPKNIKEELNINNSQQFSNTRLYKRRSYTVRQLYNIEGNQATTRSRYTIDVSDLKRRNKYSANTSSDSTQTVKYNRKFKQSDNEVNTMHVSSHKPQYKVYTTPCQQCISSKKSAERLSSSSSFWDYLFDKFNRKYQRKYQTHRMEVRPCRCSSSQMLQNRYTPDYDDDEMKSCCHQPCSGSRRQSPRVTPHSSPPSLSCNNKFCQSKNQGGVGQTQTSQPKINQADNSNKRELIKVTCKCANPKKKKGKAKDAKKQTPPQSCLRDHDELTATLARKFNAEILCIHNPPCILINGCLSVPPPRDAPVTNTWHVSEVLKTFQQNDNSNKYETKDQGCQYLKTCVDVAQLTVLTDEKKIQSICAHNPPCELVRGCNRPRFDANMQIPCVHVPVCNNIPKCAIGKSVSTACDHKPKCAQVPVCAAEETLITPTESVGNQANPQCTFVCRHEPSCIMLPKCLGRLLGEIYMPLERIPDCTHQPPCEMVPACWRKATKKQMVSVSSQYPNSCRVA